MNPPFLSFAFYVGVDGTSSAAREDSLRRLAQMRILPEYPSVIRERRGVVDVKTEGKDFSGPPPLDEDRVNALGSMVYEEFKNAIKMIDCYYAAILIEYTLETPSELRDDPRSLAFQNFYLNGETLSADVVRQVRDVLHAGAYVEEFHSGIYVSTYAPFNPKGASVGQPEAQWMSVDVARVLTSALADH